MRKSNPGGKDAVSLKTPQAHLLDQFSDLIKKVRTQANKVGLKKSDALAIVKTARKNK